MESPPLGPLIRRLRIAAGLSQEELAGRSGLSSRAISDIERGARTAPRLESLRLLAGALHLDEQDRASLYAAARPEPVSAAQSQPGGVEMRPVATVTQLPLRLTPLPLPLTRLVGRAAETDVLTALLQGEESRLVTLVGPGGVGKTHLCMEVAHHVASMFADGIAFIDLSALQRPELVPATILESLGIGSDAAATPIHSLRTALRHRSLLLVLDNFEHLLDAAPVLSDLLIACPLLTVFVTSRVRLRLRGEHVILLSPLDVPPAGLDREHSHLADLENTPSVRLFLERAREADAGFAINEQNAVVVGEICRRLDGLPLAIELAASRIATYSPESLLERLDHRLPALTGGPRDAPERQRTLAGTIAWSYDLLDAPARRVFRRLAVFSGGFSLDAAIRVTSEPGEDVASIIETLVDHSLLRPLHTLPGVDRFTMLETVREFAETAFLGSEEVVAIRQRNAGWCLELVERAGKEVGSNLNVQFWYDTMDVELPNIRSALEFMLESGDGDLAIRLTIPSMFYWMDRPFYLDLRRWLQTAVTLAPDTPSEISAHVQGTLGFIEAWLGNLERADLHLTRQLQIAEEVGTSSALTRAWLMQAVVAEYGNDPQLSATMYERALERLRHEGDFHDTQVAMAELADKWVLLGDVDRAISLLDEALAMARRGGASTLVAHSSIHRAYAAMAQNDAPLAAKLFGDSLELAQLYGMDRDALGAIAGLAGVALARGDPPLAARLFGAIAAAQQSTGISRIYDAAHAERTVTVIRNALGLDIFETCLREGASMTYEEAIAFAQEIAAQATLG